MTIDGVQLETLWSAAAERPVMKTFRTTEVGVACSHGPLLAAIDRAGRRALLIPIMAKHSLQEDLDGRAVVVRRRALEDEETYRAYACLELVDTDQVDLFTALCIEVIDGVVAQPDRAVAALKKVLADWKSLLANAHEALSTSALTGLFGELYVLREMLTYDPGAVMYWTGPHRAAQDFHRGVDAIEVKTTATVEGRRVRINGASQLDCARPGRLIVRWFRLAPGRGAAVPTLVDEISELTDDPTEFRRLLVEYGYRESEREFYKRREFEVVEHRAYEVGAEFPRVVAESFVGGAVPCGVEEVSYIVDLDSPPATACLLDDRALATFMGHP